jgi:hypothetical protein
MLDDYARMRELLGDPGAPERAAARIMTLMESSSHSA